jgi:hypothetical protein
MIRCRFKANGNDYRPVNWPVKHPYWCTGYSGEYAVIVAYADDEAEIIRNWPEARDLDSTEETEYVFTSRFRKPDWFTVPAKGE